MASTILLSDNGVSSGSAGIKTTGGDDGTLVLQTTTAGGTATNALYINTSQSVGIGTSSPTDKLSVYGGSIRLTNATTGTTGSDGYAMETSGLNAYLWNYEAGFLSFATSATERMRLDASGNLGLGVTPSAWGTSGTVLKALEIAGAGASVSGVNGRPYQIDILSNAYYNAGWKFASAANYAAQYEQYNGNHAWSTSSAASSSTGSAISFTQAMTLDAGGDLYLPKTFYIGNASNTTSQVSSGSGSANLCFGINGVEKARIDTSGNLLVGATATFNSALLYVSGSVNDRFVRFRNANANPYGQTIVYSGASPNNTGSDFLLCEDSTATRMVVRSNGGIANYSANNVNLSDSREKTNFAPAKSYLDVICAIPVQTYNYIDQNMEEDGGLTLGVVAQDVQAVAPELVTESDWSSQKDGSKMRLSIYQTDMQYALMKCIQEQQAIITSLTARITALENK